MAAEGPMAKRESADFSPGTSENGERARLTVILHSHCPMEQTCGSHSLSCPAQSELLCLPGRQPGGSQTTCSPPTVLPFPRAVSVLLGLCQGLWLPDFGCLQKVLSYDLSSANCFVKYFVKHFLK